MFSIKTQIILWLVAALVVVPIIEMLGLHRPRGADKHLSPDELERVWRNRLRQVFEHVAMIGGALGILYLMLRGLRGESDGALAIVLVILWTFGFVITTVVIAIVAHFLSGQTRTRYHLALCALFIFGFVLPLTYDRAQDRAVAEKRASIADEYMDFQKQHRLQWRQDVAAAGAHGGEGTVPPVLQVLDSGDGVQVTNISTETLCVDVRRSLKRLGPGYDYQCALWSERGGLHSCVEYAPGHTEWLRMSSRRPDLPDCAGEPLEFRVGTYNHESIGWWSDAALKEFDLHTADSSRRETTQFDTPEMRSNDFMREVMNELQTRESGPPRVARWRAQLKAANEERATLVVASPADEAGKARQLNALREAQAQLRAVQGLRERLARNPDHVRTLPDYLPVEDNLDRVTVSHPLGAVFYVKLTRSLKDPGSGLEFLCEMRGLGSGTEFGTYVSKSRPGHFELSSNAGPCADLTNSTLQMVVHDFDGRLTYASPGALDRLEAEATARVRELAPESATE